MTTNYEGELIMEYSVFVEIVAMGEELDFIYEEDTYSISFNRHGYYLTRFSDCYTQAFKTSDDLFREARINGKSILELWDKLRDNFEPYEIPVEMNRQNTRLLPAGNWILRDSNMKYDEFVKKIGSGEEADFLYNKGDHFWIHSDENGYHLMRCRDDYTQTFKTAEDLFFNAQINGKSILELWGALS